MQTGLFTSLDKCLVCSGFYFLLAFNTKCCWFFLNDLATGSINYPMKAISSKDHRHQQCILPLLHVITCQYVGTLILATDSSATKLAFITSLFNDAQGKRWTWCLIQCCLLETMITSYYFPKEENKNEVLRELFRVLLIDPFKEAERLDGKVICL